MFVAKLLSVKKLINYTLIDSVNNYVTHHGNICVTEINKKNNSFTCTYKNAIVCCHSTLPSIYSFAQG